MFSLALEGFYFLSIADILFETSRKHGGTSAFEFFSFLSCGLKYSARSDSPAVKGSWAQLLETIFLLTSVNEEV